jgi:WD40 repeat protein
MSWDPNNATRFISGSGLLIRLWDTNMGKSVLTLQKKYSGVNGSIFVQYNQRRQEYVAAGNPNGQIDLWDLRKNQNEPLHTF